MRSIARLWLAALLLVIVARGAAAQQLTLAWDANTEPDLAGYILYYGPTSSGSFTGQVDVGNVTQWAVGGLTPGVLYKFGLVAYNTSRLTSPLSNQVTGTPPNPIFVPDSTRSDFTGDHILDLLWQSDDGRLMAWVMNSSGAATPTALDPPQISDPAWKIVATVDMTGDGKPDLLWQHSTQGWFAPWQMNGIHMVQALRFTPNQQPDLLWHIVGAADMTGDGKPDLLWQREDGWFAAWEMNGPTMVRALKFEPNRQSDPNWKIVGVADITGDGWPDLIWQHQTQGWIAAWEMAGVTFERALLLNPNQRADLRWRIVAVGDVNGDGKPDFVWRSLDTGAVEAWLMDGVNLISVLPFRAPSMPDATWHVVGPR